MSDIRYSTDIPDRNAYFALFETTGWNAKYVATPEDLAIALANSWLTVTAYDNNALVGFGRVMSDGVLHAMIFDLIVHPSHQRLGIGSEILDRLLAACRKKGITDIQLFAANGMASFYERHGFKLRPGIAPGMEYSHPESSAFSRNG